MQVVNFFESNRQAHWLEEIKRSDWSAGAFLSDLIRKGAFFDAVGAESKVYISTNHIGLYEKYGCEFEGLMNDMDGTPSRVYVKRFHI